MTSAEAGQLGTGERKLLSKSRNVNLPLEAFEDETEMCTKLTTNLSLTTPITKALGNVHRSNETLHPKTDKTVKYRIYLSRLHDKSNIENEIHLTIESGSKADANALLYILSEIYKINFEVFREVFAIWMVSPFLEVQLKPYHRPLECRYGWTKLLERFSSNHPLRNAHDEPFIMLRRNVNLISEREFELIAKVPKIAPFLVIEAREMIVFGKTHFIHFDDAIEATSILYCLKFGKYDEKIHTIPFIRSKMEAMLSERLCEEISGKTIFGKNISKTTPHLEKMIEFWKKEKFSQNESALNVRLLDFLTKTSSCYGSAWFDGVIEKKPSISKKILGHRFADTSVDVGLNDRWVTIIDKQTNDVLLSQCLEEISWKLEEGTEESDEPFLMLNLNPFGSSGPSSASSSSTDTENTTAYYMMIFGKQIALIEALLKSLSAKTLTRTISSGSSSDSSTSSGKHDSIIRYITKDCSKIDDKKLCFAKLENGVCTAVAGSLKDVFVQGDPYDYE